MELIAQLLLESGTCAYIERLANELIMTANKIHTVGVSDRGVLSRLVNLFCVLPIPDGDAKRHKIYTGSGNRRPMSSLRDPTCIPCTEVLVVGGYKLRERGN